MKLLEPDPFNRKKRKNEQKRPWYSTKQYVLWLLIWSAYNLQKDINQIIRKLFRLTNWSDQNRLKRSKHTEAWRLASKLTSHKMTKCPERSEVWLFSLQEAFCFHFNVIIGLFIKKSLTSIFLNEHPHWFIFLHFDPVQIISLIWALHRFSLLSFTFWVNGL